MSRCKMVSVGVRVSCLCSVSRGTRLVDQGHRSKFAVFLMTKEIKSHTICHLCPHLSTMYKISVLDCCCQLDACLAELQALIESHGAASCCCCCRCQRSRGVGPYLLSNSSSSSVLTFIYISMISRKCFFLCFSLSLFLSTSI